MTFRKDIYTEENLRKMGLNERQVRAVKYILLNGKITSGEYQKIFSVTRETVNRDMKEMIERRIIRREGEFKGAYYTLHT